MRRFIFLLLSLFVFSGISALEFPGLIYNFDELGVPLEFNQGLCYNFVDLNYDAINDYEGILGLILHFKTISKDSAIYFKDGNEIITYNNIFGSNISTKYFVEDSQEKYLYVDLESVRDLEYLTMCSVSQNKIYFLGDSQIGSYKIPYFGSNFKKEFVNKSYKLNEKTPVKITLKNTGYDTAKVFVFYDNELFKDWFKLKNGTPSLNENILPNVERSITYNVVPLTDKMFTVSPAVLHYNYNGYNFEIYSNSLISNARLYLDEIFVDLSVSKESFDINEAGLIDLDIINDSNNSKMVRMEIKGLSNFGLNEYQDLNLGPFEEKRIQYTITSNESKIVNLDVYLHANDSNKEYAYKTIYFGKNIQNYNIIYVIFAIVLILGIIVYYRYGLK